MRDAAPESVAVGFFDGVHLGHQAILRGAAAAITFRNHPSSVLAPERAPRLVMSFGDRLAAMRACGVKDVVALDFTDALAHETPEDFMRRLFRLTRRSASLPMCVRCGEDWRFGAKGAGDAEFLRAHGVEVEVVPYAEYKGERVSSTRIRTALEAGGVADANAMLGRPFAAGGEVFRGKGEGRSLGFPTVNLHLDMAIRLPFGAYAVEVGGCRAIANYGVAPTMGERAWDGPCLEVHFLDVQCPMSDVQGVRVEFLDFIRPERKFGTKEELSRQIAADIASMGGTK